MNQAFANLAAELLTEIRRSNADNLAKMETALFDLIVVTSSYLDGGDSVDYIVAVAERTKNKEA